MGFLKKLSLYRKKNSFQERAKRFFKEYQALSRKYGCDFQGYMKIKGKNKTVPTMMSIIDTIAIIEAEKKAEEEKKNKGVMPPPTIGAPV